MTAPKARRIIATTIFKNIINQKDFDKNKKNKFLFNLFGLAVIDYKINKFYNLNDGL